MQKIVKCNQNDYESLIGIWERSVKATHEFLDETSIYEIKEALIPDYFPNVDLYAVAENDVLVGFIGLQDDKIEMLFIDSDNRGKGYGSMLLEFAKKLGATKVDVNEQNPLALAFYQAKGFRVTSRDETDDAGRPYPILHLSL
ncbi:MAG: GNAT family N-acetyltransferase [Muribaculum sp.]|nr:GNAT family N-acetyltransferase [Muribaculum sp.]